MTALRVKIGNQYRAATRDEVLDAASAYRTDDVVGTPLKSPRDSEEMLIKHFAGRHHEEFTIIFLDNRHYVLAIETMFRGTIDGTSVYPREVVKKALELNAAALILAHNHPSGIAEPSQADERITKRLRAALELIDCRVLDHIIVGGRKTVSLASRGLM